MGAFLWISLNQFHVFSKQKSFIVKTDNDIPKQWKSPCICSGRYWLNWLGSFSRFWKPQDIFLYNYTEIKLGVHYPIWLTMISLFAIVTLQWQFKLLKELLWLRITSINYIDKPHFEKKSIVNVYLNIKSERQRDLKIIEKLSSIYSLLY